MSITPRIRALTTQKSLLDARARGIVANVIEGMNQQLDNTVKGLRMEPLPKDGSRYIRTHRYSTGFVNLGVTQTREGLVGRLGRDIPIDYVEKVGGNEAGNNQWEMHNTTGWPLIAEVLRTGYQDRLRKAIRNA